MLPTLQDICLYINKSPVEWIAPVLSPVQLYSISEVSQLQEFHFAIIFQMQNICKTDKSL